MKITRVYRYGCRGPDDLPTALRLLGQAHNYREDLRRIYNHTSREVRELLGQKDDHAHVLAFVHDGKRAAIRAARAVRGHLLDAGTYWLVEAAVEQAAKACGLDPIKAERWEETGRIGAAIQSVEQFPADACAWSHKRVTLTAPDEKKHAALTLHVGALSEGRTLTWPIKLHRPLPLGAVVKQVAIQRTRWGHRFRWEALITVAFEQAERDGSESKQAVVGLDLGWRNEGALGVRICTHDGGPDIGALHIDTLEAFAYADSVRSIRDQNFEDAKDYAKKAGLPGADHVHLWRDKDRMHRLALRTQDLGPVWWRERDRHLEDIECRARLRAVRRRLDRFRVYADTLAKRYRYVALEDMPIIDWVGEADTKKQERQRSAASLGLLQQVIVQRFGADRVDWVPAMNTSRRCSACDHVRAEAVGPDLHWTCASCGVVHHQDENAAENIRRDSERWLAAGNPPRARTKKARKKEKKERGDGIATGTNVKMTVTPREPFGEAAE